MFHEILGWFELKLCPTNDKSVLETEKCMNKHPLYLIDDPTSTKFYIPPDSKKKDTFNYKVQLPPNVVCSQCVLQWTYRTGKVAKKEDMCTYYVHIDM